MNAANDFEKDFFKLMINCVYGKTMETLRKKINVRLVINAEDFLKQTSKPTYITHKMFNKNFAAIREIKPVLMLNKAIYVGFTVLYLSKLLTYNFHYNFIKKMLMLNCYLLSQKVLLMKQNQKILMKSFLNEKICLTLVTIQKMESFLVRQIKKLLASYLSD